MQGSFETRLTKLVCWFWRRRFLKMFSNKTHLKMDFPIVALPTPGDHDFENFNLHCVRSFRVKFDFPGPVVLKRKIDPILFLYVCDYLRFEDDPLFE
jgi:hypothetical protein